jgi:hypothetical protein
MVVVFIRGATAWEGQIDRLWFGLLRPSFWRTGFPVFVRWAPDDDA